MQIMKNNLELYLEAFQFFKKLKKIKNGNSKIH